MSTAHKIVIKELNNEITDLDVTNQRMSCLLTRSVNAIRGEPAPLHRHSWHDLPDLIYAMKVDLLAAKLDLMQAQKTINKFIDQ